jgi:hypothetical protein
MKKNMVYFVMYLVLIVELLIVITERDELEEKEVLIRDKMLNTLVESYKQPLILSIPQRTSDYDLASKDPIKVVLTPAGLVSDAEKEHLKFYVNIDKSSKSIPAGWPSKGITLSDSTSHYKLHRENGNAVLVADFSKDGDYKFVAYCTVVRQFPEYLPEYLLDALSEKVGEFKTATSGTEKFEIKVKALGGVNKKSAEISF